MKDYHGNCPVLHKSISILSDLRGRGQVERPLFLAPGRGSSIPRNDLSALASQLGPVALQSSLRTARHLAQLTRTLLASELRACALRTSLPPAAGLTSGLAGQQVLGSRSYQRIELLVDPLCPSQLLLDTSPRLAGITSSEQGESATWKSVMVGFRIQVSTSLMNGLLAGSGQVGQSCPA